MKGRGGKDGKRKREGVVKVEIETAGQKGRTEQSSLMLPSPNIHSFREGQGKEWVEP